MHHTEDTTIEQTVTEAPEIEELTDETVGHAPRKGGLFVFLRVFRLGGL